MFAMIFFVNPSISFGLAFFATLDKDLVMIFRPFLPISMDFFPISGTGKEDKEGVKWTYWRA
jgi:hypothetical protein